MRVTRGPERLQKSGQIDRRGLAFDSRVRGQNDLLNFILMDAIDQALDLQLFRADAAQRRNGAVQHVIHAAKAVRGFNRENVVRFFDHADL